MSDVAALAGVSHQTVSRVINGHPNVAPQTRERVEAAIAELGYRPNIAARALVTGSTRTIGLVTVKINQYGPAQTMLGLEEAARAAGYSLSASRSSTRRPPGAMREAVDTFVAQRGRRRSWRSAPTTTPPRRSARSTPPVPLVAVQVGGDEDRPAVGVDQETGARLATRHLLELGHRTVHHVAGPADSQGGPGPHRRAGAAELLAAGAPVPELLRGDWTPSSGYAAGTAARRPAPRPATDVTAVFLANDQMALGLLAALHEEGIAVPGDVSVVGFDDLPEAPYFTRRSRRCVRTSPSWAAAACELVLARLRGEDLHPDAVPAPLWCGRAPGRARRGRRSRRRPATA